MSTIRGAFSALFETKMLNPFRHAVARNRALSDAHGTLASALSNRVKVLSPEDLVCPSTKNRSSDLFILGSGPTVLELNQAKLARIRAGTSVGINSWLLHDFIPDAYALEEMENEEYIPVARAHSALLGRPEVINAQPLILHLRPKSTTPSRRLARIPEVLGGRVRYYGRVTPETHLLANLETDLTHLIRAKRSGKIADHVLIDSGSSVARMVSLGITRGYSRIVLVGVDLGSSAYFFEADPSYLTKRNLERYNPSLDRGAIHDTERQSPNRKFLSSTFLSELSKASVKLGGPQIFVGSANSRLAEALQVYRW